MVRCDETETVESADRTLSLTETRGPRPEACPGKTFCARIIELRRPDRLMRDFVTWEAPFGMLGRVADALFLERHMRWFVATKQKQLKALIERAL